MMRAFAAALCVLALAPSASWGQTIDAGAAPQAAQPTPPPARPTRDVSMGFVSESLTNGQPAWTSRYVGFTLASRPNDVWYSTVQTLSRFDQTATELDVGRYVPLGGRSSAFVEADLATPRAKLPQGGASAGVSLGSGAGFFESVTYRRTAYAFGSVDATSVGVERYWKAFRVGYTVTGAAIPGIGTDWEHAAAVDYYYGPGSSVVGLRLTAGRELENVGTPVPAASNVLGASITGRHWFRPSWGLSYSLGRFRQGTAYTRTGGGLGLDRRF